jgi:hypothetical protein
VPDLDQLVSLVHVPSPAGRNPKLVRQIRRVRVKLPVLPHRIRVDIPARWTDAAFGTQNLLLVPLRATVSPLFKDQAPTVGSTPKLFTLMRKEGGAAWNIFRSHLFY